MQSILEKRYNNMKFLIIIDFYILFFREEIHKSFIYNI